MNEVKAIRERLGVTQTELGAAIGCTQGNVGHYERGQTLPPEAAKRLIGFAASRGLALTLDQIYGLTPLDAPASAPTGEKPMHVKPIPCDHLELVDRRERAVPIDFPDRRKPAGDDGHRKAA